ncbi:glutathione S-transferase family protein [Pelagibius marinus]|uniref:glutathione S-transferase family protein n=1 Tax=Pelagibius marinus TaxID=2762760 RepID=UPI0018722AD9|nr:glutathione S-transferase family protein [Pelagibius marinus]
MTCQVSAFRWVPEFAQGYVRDLRVRWALEEAGLPYEAVLVGLDEKDADSYRAWQPFGQVPAYRDDEVEMFESGAIVLHIAEKSEALCPRGAGARARVMTWVIAALNSVEPFAWNLIFFDGEGADEDSVSRRRAKLETALDGRLTPLEKRLAGREYLEDRFTAGDIVMSTALRELDQSGALARYPALLAYVERCTARPAFARALEAQMKVFRENAAA